MSYTLEAVLGETEVLRPAVSRLPAAVLVPLCDDIVLLPMTNELRAAFGLGFVRELTSWSARGPVAYVEAEFFGGVGSQHATLWAGGELALGPLFVDEGDPFDPEGSPISQVLARLGVARGDHYDEFQAAGLDRHRDTAEWLP